MKVSQAWVAPLALVGAMSLAASARGQVALETPGGGIRDSSEAGGTSVSVGRDIDSAPVTPDVTAAGISSPQTRMRLQEDAAEREMLKKYRLEDRVKLQPGRAGSYDLSAAGAYGGDSWRFRFYKNYWWYWQPNNTWAVYYQNRWIPYTGVYAYPTFYPGVGTPGGDTATSTYDSLGRYHAGYRANGPGLGGAPPASGLQSNTGIRPVTSDGYNGTPRP